LNLLPNLMLTLAHMVSAGAALTGPQWAMKAIQTNTSNRGDSQWVLEIDIAKCFDSINHQWLMYNVPYVPKHFLREWFSQGYMIRDYVFPPTR